MYKDSLFHIFSYTRYFLLFEYQKVLAILTVVRPYFIVVFPNNVYFPDEWHWASLHMLMSHFIKIFFWGFVLFFSLEHILPYVFILPGCLCLFLCSKWHSCLSQSWRSGLVKMMTYVTQNPIHPLIPPPLSAIQGASPMWIVCAFWLWLMGTEHAQWSLQVKKRWPKWYPPRLLFLEKVPRVSCLSSSCF